MLWKKWWWQRWWWLCCGKSQESYNQQQQQQIISSKLTHSIAKQSANHKNHNKEIPLLKAWNFHHKQFTSCAPVVSGSVPMPEFGCIFLSITLCRDPFHAASHHFTRIKRNIIIFGCELHNFFLAYKWYRNCRASKISTRLIRWSYLFNRKYQFNQAKCSFFFTFGRRKKRKSFVSINIDYLFHGNVKPLLSGLKVANFSQVNLRNIRVKRLVAQANS